MKIVFLVALFNLNGEWTMLEGFYPLPTDGMAHCEERLSGAEDYLSKQKGLPEFHVTCIETIPEEGRQAVQDYIAKNLAKAL